MSAIHIRPAERGDLQAVYDICLKTGDGGEDATHLYRDPKLIGHIYAGPYLTLDSAVSLVACDDEGVLGYAAGSLDTPAFERMLETEWWPNLQRVYPDPDGPSTSWSADEKRCFAIHHPSQVPDDIVRAYPAHIHMNLLPRAQGKGVGSRLLAAWLDAARQRRSRGRQRGQSKGACLLDRARISSGTNRRDCRKQGNDMVRAQTMMRLVRV